MMVADSITPRAAISTQTGCSARSDFIIRSCPTKSVMLTTTQAIPSRERDCMTGGGATAVGMGTALFVDPRAPGKVVREMSEEAIEGLKKSAIGYQNNMRRFRDGMTKID